MNPDWFSPSFNHASAPSAVVPDRVCRAAEPGILGHGGLSPADRLPKDEAGPPVLLAREHRRSIAPAQVTIDAAGIHVVGARNVLRNFVVLICHKSGKLPADGVA